jgi:hypothetical protein
VKRAGGFRASTSAARIDTDTCTRSQCVTAPGCPPCRRCPYTAPWRRHKQARKKVIRSPPSSFSAELFNKAPARLPVYSTLAGAHRSAEATGGRRAQHVGRSTWGTARTWLG